MSVGKTGKKQTKLELLESYRYFEADYKSSEYMVEKWKAKLEYMVGTQSDSGTFSGGALPGDRVGEYIELWEGIVDRLLERMAIMNAKMIECESVCDELPTKYGVLMRMKYICRMTWREVGERLSYSEDWVKEMGDQARNMLK